MSETRGQTFEKKYRKAHQRPKTADGKFEKRYRKAHQRPKTAGGNFCEMKAKKLRNHNQESAFNNGTPNPTHRD